MWWAVVRNGTIWYNSSTSFAAVSRLYGKQLAVWNDKNKFFGALSPQRNAFPNYKWDDEILRLIMRLLANFGFSTLVSRIFGPDRGDVVMQTLQGGPPPDEETLEEIILSYLPGGETYRAMTQKRIIPPEVMRMILYFAFYAPDNFEDASDSKYVQMDEIVVPSISRFPVFDDPVRVPPKNQMLATYTWKESDPIPTKPNEYGMGSASSFLRLFPDAAQYMAGQALPPIPMPVVYNQPTPGVENSVLYMAGISATLALGVFLATKVRR